MIILGSNSEVAQAFVERVLQSGFRPKNIHLFTSDTETTEKFARHLEVKYIQQSSIHQLDLLRQVDYNQLETISGELLFCATGYLGQDTAEGLYNIKNTERIININYAKLIPVLTFFAGKMERQRHGTMIVLSSVAGDRGRQSNFIYGSAKAGLTAYLSGLRNYMSARKVHVLTIKPGFMDTKMTAGLQLPKPLTATPAQAADHIFKAYKAGKNTAYVLPVWFFIMTVIRNIPEFIFRKMKL